ncbi:Carnitine palmitoyltransferase [Cichlidogyrus casuarinus]|uniref:carnitine O-palmitoyltransferase n=1 Tax=Cichlidogyrus casuarinus TaxID=1844966 RepID=A0ABD2QMR3_9PLAT
MAEAHAAVAFSFVVTDEGVAFRYDKEVINAVLNSGIRTWKRLTAHFKNSIYNRIYPFHISSWLYFVLFVFMTLYLKLEQTTRLFGHFEVFYKETVGLNHYHLPACLTLSFFLWITGVLLNKILLRSLLLWKGFMFIPPGKSTSTLKLWALMLKIASSSRVRLYSYQDALPCLPVPSLSDTIERYLLSVKPLLSEEKFSSLSKKAYDFASSYNGKKLQFYVKMKWLLSSNYVSDWWEDYVYLANRSPLLSNSNYYGMGTFVMGDKPPYFELPGQAPRCAMFCMLLLELRRMIAHETMKPLMLRNLIPLCSGQYERQFNTTRIPQLQKDKIIHLNSSDHIVVQHRGRYFKCLIKKNGRLIRPRDLEYTLECILHDESEPQLGEERLAAFTAGPRDNWAEARKDFFSSGVNKTSLDAIEKAAFTVSLDQEEYPFKVKDIQDPELLKQINHFSKRLLHGNACDRWFDKSFHMIIDRNGQFGFNEEHSWADAPVNAHKVENVLIWEATYNEEKRPFFHYEGGHCHGEAEYYLKPQRLKWNMPNKCLEMQEESYRVAKALADDTDMNVSMFDEYGRGFIKKANFSPDAFLQMTLQLAVFLDMQKFLLTYEASMTRLYRDGRTETVRSCTEQSCRFIKAFFDKSVSVQEKMNLLREACENHQRLYRLAMTGKGVDRHLFSLYVVSKFLNIEMPFLKEVLSEPWRLSTSQTAMGQNEDPKNVLNTYLNVGGGFGPVSEDGYGVSYMFIGEKLLSFHISSKFSCSSTSSERFATNIAKSLRMLRELVEEDRASVRTNKSVSESKKTK